MKKKLEHITITSGHTRPSRLSEVRPSVIKLICDAFAKSNGKYAELGEFRVEMIEAPRGTWVYDIYFKGERMVACWLCADTAMSDFLWSHASGAGTLESAKLRHPSRTPWLAVALCFTPTTMMKFLAASSKLGDLERCVAWALMTAAQPASTSTCNSRNARHASHCGPKQDRAGGRP